jgi:hypothetical protein
MSSVNYHIFRHNGNLLINETDELIKYCKELITLMGRYNTYTEKISRLIDHMYVINYYYSVASLMQLTTNVKEWSTVDTILEQYMQNNFYKNTQVFSDIKKLLKKSKDFNDVIFLTKLLKQFKENKTNESCDLQITISKKTSLIREKLEDGITFNIYDSIRNVFKHSGIGIESHVKFLKIDRRNYYYFQKHLNDAHVRLQIEKEYCKKYFSCLDDLAKVVIMRNAYAKSNNCISYFQYKQQKTQSESDDIKILINDLIAKIDVRAIKEANRFKKSLEQDGIQKKVNQCDMIYYHEKLRTKIKFSFDDVLTVLTRVVHTYFGLTISNMGSLSNENLWNDDIVTLTVQNNDGTINGVIYVDVIKRKHKNINTFICIPITHRYIHKLCKLVNPTQVALLGSCDTLNSSDIGFPEVITLFREFGNALHQIISHGTTGSFNFDPEFGTILSQIMEYVLWEKNTLDMLCHKMKQKEIMVDHILFTRYIDFAILIKTKCVNALFDHIIHSSASIINMLTTQNANGGFILLSLYKKIYNDVMSSLSEYVNIDVENINHHVIIQELNGSEGLLYSNILCEILSYSIYQSIKHGNGIIFVNTVLTNNATSLRKLLYSFIENSDEDSYDMYLQEIIGFNEIDTRNKHKRVTISESSNNTNYFDDDDTETHSDDVENVIHIDRTL